MGKCLKIFFNHVPKRVPGPHKQLSSWLHPVFEAALDGSLGPGHK